MKKTALILIIPALLMMGACATDIGANQYDSSAVGSVTRALKGTVISVRNITVRDSDKSAGTAVGALAGGVAGRGGFVRRSRRQFGSRRIIQPIRLRIRCSA